MSEERNAAILQHALEYFKEEEKREGYFELYDENAVLHGYVGVEPGLTSIKQFYNTLWAAFPDSRVEIEALITKNDMVVCRFVMYATHRGDFMGVAATGKAIQLPGITILRFTDGKCVERWSQADFLGLLAQLGSQPA